MAGARQGLLSQAAAGDAAAVRECVACFGGIVWGLARRLSPSRADAEDAVQEIFLDLWAHGGRHDPARASQEAFVAVIARRRLIDRRRRASRRLALEPIEPAEPVSQELSAETAAEAGLAARAMQGLRPEQREVLRLSVAEGLSHQEISEQTGMPLGTVKAHARRGLLRIRGILSGERSGASILEEEIR